MILKAWVDYVHRTLVSVGDVRWGAEIPGYNTIVDTLLHEMELIQPTLYPDSLKETILSFLSNVRLLDGFVKIVFKKTSAYDSLAVIKTMELVAAWFQRIHKNQLLIPPDFDFPFFFKGIKILLDLDHGT